MDDLRSVREPLPGDAAVIARLTAEQLRSLADQLDAHTTIKRAGGRHLPSDTVLTVNGAQLAYAHWWQDGEQWMAEFICFTPGDAEPLIWHVGPGSTHGPPS